MAKEPTSAKKTHAAGSHDDPSSARKGAQAQADNERSAESSADETAEGSEDAIAMLKADHRRVEGLFAKFKNAKSNAEKGQIAKRICNELIVHTLLEEEIFYPACRDEDIDENLLDEAQVEHDSAKVLIRDLMNDAPEEEYYDAKVTVLSEYIRHHIAEEEKAGEGIMAKAEKAEMDLKELGQRITLRKQQLQAKVEADTLPPPVPKALTAVTVEGPIEGMEEGMDEMDGADRDRDESRYEGRPRHGEGRRRGAMGGGYGEAEEYRGGRMRREGSGYGRAEAEGYGRKGFSRDEDEETGRASWRQRSRGSEGGGYGRFEREEGMARRSRAYGGEEEEGERRSLGRGSSASMRARDDQGRFESDEDYRSSYRGRGRDEDDEIGGYRRGAARYGREDEGDRGRRGGGWFGDSEDHSEAAERGWEERQSRGGARGSSRSEGRRGSRSGEGGDYYGSRGSSQSARRGWEGRD